MKKYARYTLPDFLKDESFQDWVLTPGYDSDQYWQQVMASCPAQEPVIRQARQLLLGVGFNAYTFDPADQQYTLDQIYEKIRTPVVPISGKLRPVLRKWTRVAAVAAGIIVSGTIIFLLSVGREVRYATGYGQEQTITLPDGSEVTLRAHSSLKFHKRSFSDPGRDVWISGEAIFHVKHLEDNRNFVVHTSDNFRVEVLGTHFLVHKRDSATMVFLQSGKVKLHVDEKNSFSPDELIMQPGEVAKFSGNHPAQLLKQHKPLAGVASWDGKSLLLDNTTLKEVVDFLQDTYGLTVRVADNNNLQLKVSGTLPLGNLNTLLTGLSTVYGLSFSYSGEKNILIKAEQ